MSRGESGNGQERGFGDARTQEVATFLGLTPEVVTFVEEEVAAGTLGEVTGTLASHNADWDLFTIAMYLKIRYEQESDADKRNNYKQMFYIVKNHWESSDVYKRPFEIELE